MQAKSDSFVSVVTVVSASDLLLEAPLAACHALLSASYSDFEIVIVVQPSGRHDHGNYKLDDELNRLTGIRMLRLATPVAHDVAVSAGLENAIGDFVVIMSLGIDPAEAISGVVNVCKMGADVVIGTSRPSHSIAYRLLRPPMTRLLRSVGYDVPKNATHLRCLSRRAVNAVTQAGRFHHQLFVRMQKLGYPSAVYPYERSAEAPKKTLRIAIRETLRLLVFNSTKPLRWMIGLGVMVAGVSALVGSVRLVLSLSIDNHLNGTDLSLLLVSLVALCLFAAIGFMGEYIARLLDERSEQFAYALASEKSSSVMLIESRFNVTSVALEVDAATAAPQPARGSNA